MSKNRGKAKRSGSIKANKATKAPKLKKSPATKSASLAGPSGMGGIIGGGGYDFQSRYIACHIPEWLGDPAFTQVFHEGTGDADIEFGNSKRRKREHIQIKDHPVITKGEFKQVIDTFVGIDQGMPGAYTRFTLACPSLGPTIQPLERALKRYRDAVPFYSDKPEALKDTLQDIRKRIASLNLTSHQDFIIEKLHIQVGLNDFHNDGLACDTFAMNLVKHPAYSQKLVDILKPAYTALLREVISARGKPLHRQTIQDLIDKSLKEQAVNLEPSINLVIHNWTKEKFDIEAHHTLDWSTYFERETRKVPEESVWNEELLPQLYTLRKQIAADTMVRLIRLRGKNTLSTGIALGAAFPEIGGWIFEIPQPPLILPWRSDAVPEMSYALRSNVMKGNSTGDSIAFIFNIKGSALHDVKSYIKDRSLRVKAILAVEPAGAAGSLSIANDREAVSLALAARDQLRAALDQYKVRSTHLFFYGPFALSVFIGQYLSSIGQVQLYEFQDPGYVPSFSLRT
jgi:hypothetical protein